MQRFLFLCVKAQLCCDAQKFLWDLQRFALKAEPKKADSPAKLASQPFWVLLRLGTYDVCAVKKWRSHFFIWYK